MIDCDRVRPMLTGYLDGDLEGDAGTVVRGHLRECTACREVAETEAALRDGLRALPSVAPPPGMWNAVRAKLAEAEVAESHRPAWRRALARWAPAVRTSVPYAGVLAAAALAVIVWRARHNEIEQATPDTGSEPHVAVVGPSNITTPDHPNDPHVTPPVALTASDADVTADLARDAARRDDSLRDAATDLQRQLADVRATWPDDRKRELDARVAELQHAVDTARDGRPRHAAYRAMIRYLQNALARDEVALADVAPAGARR